MNPTDNPLKARSEALYESLSHLIDESDAKDVQLLTRLSHQFAIAEQCQSKVEELGLIVEDNKGNQKANPYINIAYNANGLVLRYAKMIGIKKDDLSLDLDLE